MGGRIELKQLVWANPTVEEALLWLTEGARAGGPCLGDELPSPMPGKRRARKS